MKGRKPKGDERAKTLKRIGRMKLMKGRFLLERIEVKDIFKNEN
jgi:hypothetical protein